MPMDILEAAQGLVINIGAPPQAHSIWVKTTVDPHTKEFVKKICVSIHPRYKGELNIPKTHEGYPVERIAWPEGMK